MEINGKIVLLFITILSTAMSAGLFYGWVVSVIPGLKNITLKPYLEAMQSINKSILNIGFFSIFFGTMVLMLVNAFLHYDGTVNLVFILMVGACLVYIVGAIGVTMYGNVPLNNMLEKLDLNSSSIEILQDMRMRYEEKWNQLHNVRTLAAVLSFALLVIGALVDR